MNRGVQIALAAGDFIRNSKSDLADSISFLAGACWADAHPNWISVEDELPPQNGRYIFYSDTMGVRTSYYYAGISLNEHVTHWMPLPDEPVVSK